MESATSQSPADGAREGSATETRPTPQRLSVEVLGAYPHDRRAFTQGLVWDGGLLYESTGLYGNSSVRRVEPTSGEVLARALLDPSLFGEGLAQVADRLVLLTWKAGVALVYDVGTLEPLDQFSYAGEGWGLTYDGRRLIMSDGTSHLTFRDPVDLRPLASREVTFEGRPLARLNELEWTREGLYANVWGTERIVRIDPENGRVTAYAELSDLLTPTERAGADVLNGIAYDPVSDTFWITGKFWPKIFRIRFHAAPPAAS